MNNWNKILFILLSILIIAVCAIGCYVDIKSGEGNDLRIKSIEIRIDSLSTGLGTLVDRLDSLDTKIVNLESADSISQDNIESLNKSLRSLRRDLEVYRDVKIFDYRR